MYHSAVRGVISIVYVYLGSGKLNNFWLLINERELAPNDLVSCARVCVLAMMMYSPCLLWLIILSPHILWDWNSIDKHVLLIRERNRERLKKNRGNSEESALVAIRPGHQSLELTELLKIKIYTGVKGSLMAQLVKNLSAMQETPVQFLGWEDLLEKGYATLSSLLRLPLWLSW